MSVFTKEVNEYLLGYQQGDKSQLGLLFNKTAMHLRGVARIYLVNKSYDEDVVSDTFVKVSEYIHSFDNNQNGYNWLCKIVQNTALTYNGGQAKSAKVELKYVRDNVKLLVEDDFDAFDFLMMISELDEPDHTIAIKRFCFGCTYDEIGKEYNVSRVAIFSRVRKICKIICKKISPKGKQK